MRVTPSLTVALLLLASSAAAHAEPTIIDLTSPAGGNSSLPHLSLTPQGQVLMSWVESSGSTHQLKAATLTERTWSKPVTVSEGDNWFVNWADFPSVIALTDQHWAAHWLAKKEGGKYAYDVVIAKSSDQGTTWHPAFTPHQDNTPTEHGFVSLFPINGVLGAIWLDGRNTQTEEGSEHAHGGGMTLRSGWFGSKNQAEQGDEIDSLVCDCCQTDATTIPDGIVIAYRDRSPENIRDIAVRRLNDNQWSEATHVGNDQWQINGCPVNGPAIAANENHVAVAWYTQANNQPTVKIAFSDDGGQSFSNAVIVDTDDPIGRVDVVMPNQHSAIVSWVGTQDGKGQLKLQQVDRDGGKKNLTIGLDHGLARANGFPQMVMMGEKLVFAWTESGETKQVKTAVMRYSNPSHQSSD